MKLLSKRKRTFEETAQSLIKRNWVEYTVWEREGTNDACLKREKVYFFFIFLLNTVFINFTQFPYSLKPNGIPLI